MELAKAYDPKSVQEEIGAQWDAKKLWHSEPDDRPRDKRYSIVIPPPNVTGALHLGHALNNTLQDILIRVHRMRGDNTVWLPGTDHAGIATQTVVDKRLQAEGKPALKEYKQIEAAGGNGREQFLDKVNEWKTEYEARILGQLKAMGCSCDWDRTAFTMDEQRSKAVREAFFQLFKAGLIYRGKRLVNWDPVTQTALADDEVEMEEVDGSFYYLKYPVCDAQGTLLNAQGVPSLGLAGAHTVTVATTRPETMLGDTAVAVNPKDPRAASLRGKFVKLPIVDRIIPIIEDDYVVLPLATTPSGVRSEPSGSSAPEDPKAKFSSGFLKVTPAHDPNDYMLGQKYNLAQINVMAPDASISLDHGWSAIEPTQKDNPTLKPFLGQSRELARESIVTWFKQHGLLEKIIPYRHSVGHSYRSHAAIEPYLSDQWYCKVTDPRLAQAANAALAPDQRSSASSPPAGEAGRGAGSTTSTPPSTAARPLSQPLPQGEGSQNPVGLRFFPERYAKTYETWHNNIRDWCISRQLWWGHRIPVWYVSFKPNRERISPDECWQTLSETLNECASVLRIESPFWIEQDSVRGIGHVVARTSEAASVLISIEQWKANEMWTEVRPGEQPTTVARASHANPAVAKIIEKRLSSVPMDGFIQDPDVLDTWFSSALWPLSTLGWPEDRAAEATPPAAASSSLSTPNSQQSTVDYWNPTSVLATGRDIITLWVSRMVMFNLFLRSDEATKARSDEGGTDPSSLPRSVASSLSSVLPFHHVYINPTIQDGQGQRMSKSLGNGVDPIDIISTHGADAMRYTLADMATQTQDARLPVDLIDPHTGETFEPKFITNHAGYVVAAPIQEHKGKKCVSSYGYASGAAKPTDDMPLAKNTSAKFDAGRNFCNKLWNAGRFILVQVGSGEFGVGSSSPSTLPTPHSTLDESKWSTVDRWILSRLARTIQTCNESIDVYRFDLYAKACYDFVWRDFCDWYLEASKPAMKDPARRGETGRVLATCFDVALRLMHPMIPFITEKLWSALNDTGAPRGIDDRFPCMQPSVQDGSHAATKALVPNDSPSAHIMTAPYPTFTDRTDTLTSEGAERVILKLQEIVTAIRQVRNDNKVDPKKRVNVTLQCPADVEHHLSANREFIEGLSLSTIDSLGPDAPEPVNAAKTVAAGVAIHVAGVIDAGAAEKRKAQLVKSIAGYKNKLGNESYVNNAPPKVVEETRAMMAAAEAELAKLG
jgi:valyl-tRNA synthetase